MCDSPNTVPSVHKLQCACTDKQNCLCRNVVCKLVSQACKVTAAVHCIFSIRIIQNRQNQQRLKKWMQETYRFFACCLTNSLINYLFLVYTWPLVRLVLITDSVKRCWMGLRSCLWAGQVLPWKTLWRNKFFMNICAQVIFERARMFTQLLPQG